MKHLIIPMILGLSIAISACDIKQDGLRPKTDADVVKNEVRGAIIRMEEKADREREEFINKARHEMDEINKDIAALKQKLQTKTGEAKQKLDEMLLQLEQENREAEQKLADLKAATTEKWQTLKSGVTSAINDLKAAIQKTKDDSA